MLANVPVYSTQNNTHFVNVYTELEDGTFRRTQNEPLRLLRDDIAGISMSQGELVSQQYDRHNRQWTSATVTFHYGRPQSIYQFLRDKVAQNKIFVFSKPTLSGHLIRFDVHELRFKASMSQRKLSILKEKYLEALDLWSKEDYEKRQSQSDQTQTNSFEHEKTQKIKLVKVNPQDRRLNMHTAQTHPGRRQSDQPNRAVFTTGWSDKVIAFTSDDNDETVRMTHRTHVSGSSDHTTSIKSVPASVEDSGIKKKQANPFGSKTMTRSSHFLRRFLFHDR